MKNKANVGMGVTATIVFACESHREAWLKRMGFFGNEYQQADYERRRNNTDLVYVVGAEGPSDRPVSEIPFFEKDG